MCRIRTMSVRARSFLWFQNNAEEAANLYTSLIENSEIRSIERVPVGESDAPEVIVINFTIGGQEFVIMQAPGGPEPNNSFSISILCNDQAEVDRIWDALVEGGEGVACGWLRDRYGISWQVTPKRMNELMEAGNSAQRAAVMQAMMGMVKFDIAGLERAFEESK